MTNESDAFDENGPDIGESLYVYNYYGPGLIRDSEGYFNEQLVKYRTPSNKHQVWKVAHANLIHRSGNTDSDFFCSMERDLSDPQARI